MTKEPSLEYPDRTQERAPSDTFRILFLDSAPNVELLKEAGKGAGYVVVGAETIVEAMTFLEGTDHVDVIVCAAHLETESMFVFLNQVRGQPAHENIRFLILSLAAGTHGSRLDHATAEAGVVLGADAYQIMPVFDAPALIAHIRVFEPAVPTLRATTTGQQRLA